MNLEDCFEIGYIVKAHGTKGEIYLQLDTDYPEDYYEMESVFLKTKDGLVPFFLEYIDFTSSASKLIVKFDETNSKNEADALKGLKVYLTLENLPELNIDQFYYHEIIDFEVIDESKGNIGKIENVYEMPGDDILSVTNKERREILIPLSNTIYKSIDKEKKHIYVNCPEGLIDLYLSESKHQPNDED